MNRGQEYQRPIETTDTSTTLPVIRELPLPPMTAPSGSYAPQRTLQRGRPEEWRGYCSEYFLG